MPYLDAAVELAWSRLAFTGRVSWERSEPEELLRSDLIRLPHLRTLRLGVMWCNKWGCRVRWRIPAVSLDLLDRLEAVQVDLGSRDTVAAMELPPCYFETTAPILLDVSLIYRESLEQQAYRIQQFECIQLRTLDPAYASRLYWILVNSARLRALFVARELIERYNEREPTDKATKTLRRLCSKLKAKGAEVILCGPDDDEFILPEFLDYIKTKRKNSGRA